MKTIDEIKQMMVAGDAAKAAEALKELLAKEPEDLQAKMLYGTCCQLLGDEETFKRIHDEIAPVMERRDESVVRPDDEKMWKRFHLNAMEYVVIGTLVAVGAAVAMAYYGKKLTEQTNTLYSGPVYKQCEREVQQCERGGQESEAVADNDGGNRK